MTTYDSKYKHKPSEKHTLEEVLKSLQDLIRNDLPEDKSAGTQTGTPSGVPSRSVGESQERDEQKPHPERSLPVREDFAPSNPASGPVNFDAVMRSLRDLINNELDVGDQPAPDQAQAPPASEPPLTTEKISEDEVTQEEEPTFEDIDQPTSSGEQTASFSEPPETGERIGGELEALHEELRFEDTDALNIDEEFISSEETAPPPDESATAEELADEVVRLDEELTIEDLPESAPSPPVESDGPELPGEISPELLAEPELTAPAVEPERAEEETTAPDTQQEFFLGEPAPSIVEYFPPSQDLPPEPPADLETAPVTEDIPPEVTDESAAEPNQGISGEALPTIEVEETFDDSAYREADVRQVEPQAPENQEIQNTGASTIVAPAVTETTPDTASEDHRPAQDLKVEAETEPETAPAKSEPKLEITEEPLPESSQSVPSVDFDTVEFEPPQKESHDSDVIAESTAPVSEPPPAPVEPPAMAETLETTVTVTEESPPAEEKAESVPEPEQQQATDITTSAPAASENLEMAPDAGEEPGTPPSSDLDDIPVLKEVVAPPAGSTLVPDEESPPAKPRLPAPDRARNIVVRAVAKLNVEMRKSGGAGLDTKTILRLQKLIRQELEKDSEK